MATTEADQHYQALLLYRRAVATMQEQNNLPNNVNALVAEADAIMKKATFDFFGLPAEIRDLIYDECLMDRRSERYEFGRFLQKKSAHTEIQQVCRQFRDEYRARAKKQMELVLVVENDYCCRPDPRLALPSTFKEYPRVAIICELPVQHPEDNNALHGWAFLLPQILVRLDRQQQVCIYIAFSSGVSRKKYKEHVLYLVGEVGTSERTQVYSSRVVLDKYGDSVPWSTGKVRACWSAVEGCFEAKRMPEKRWEDETPSQRPAW